MSRHLARTTRRPTFLPALALATVLALPAPPALAQSYLPKIGGSGGSSFDARCPAGQYLTGMDLFAADDVDAVRPICITSSPTGNIGYSPSNDSFAWHGGRGGAPTNVMCPPRSPVVLGVAIESEGVDTTIVNSIALYCGTLANESQTVANYPSAMFEGPRYQASKGFLGILIDGNSGNPRLGQTNCPSGQVAIGIHGRSGTWVDAIGLVCDAPQGLSKPVPYIGRIGTGTPSGPAMSLCERAADARTRNSPVAARLEAMCRQQPARPLARTNATAASVPMTARSSAEPVRSIGRSNGGSLPPRRPICDAAADARARNSPMADRLQANCDAYLASLPPAPELDPAEAPLPR